jgi:hypothetical protein
MLIGKVQAHPVPFMKDKLIPYSIHQNKNVAQQDKVHRVVLLRITVMYTGQGAYTEKGATSIMLKKYV